MNYFRLSLCNLWLKSLACYPMVFQCVSDLSCLMSFHYHVILPVWTLVASSDHQKILTMFVFWGFRQCFAGAENIRCQVGPVNSLGPELPCRKRVGGRVELLWRCCSSPFGSSKGTSFCLQQTMPTRWTSRVRRSGDPMHLKNPPERHWTKTSDTQTVKSPVCIFRSMRKYDVWEMRAPLKNVRMFISLFSWCLSIDPLATELLYCGKMFGTDGPLKVFCASAKN